MRDFSLSGSPGNARRLMMMANIASVSISETIRALSEEGLIDEGAFAPFPTLRETEKQAVQNLVDCGLRAMLLSEGTSSARRTVLTTLKIAQSNPIIIATDSAKHWNNHCTEYGLSSSDNPNDNPDCLIVSPRNLVQQSVLSERRHGVLILDRQTGTSETFSFTASTQSRVAREVPRTIVIQNYASEITSHHGWSRQADIRLQTELEELWSMDALQILKQTSTIVSAMKQRSFRKFRTANLYFMFNVVSDLLGDNQPK